MDLLYSISFILLILFSFYTCTLIASIHDHDDVVSINCGWSSAATASDGREWRPDAPHTKGSSIASTLADELTPTVDPFPHKTARLSRSHFSYTFPVSPGQKILRLHFYAAPYRGFKGSKDLFSVEAAAFTLLRNFSASALGVGSLVKEYCINVEIHHQFRILFSAEISPLFDTYAFINGIEILSLPADALSYFKRGVDAETVGKSLVYVDGFTALEIVRRLNIRKDSVSDFGEREMVPNQKSIKGENATWITSVDVGFKYLIRIHFSELGLKMVEIFGLNFKLRINGMIVIDSDIGIVGEMDDQNSTHLYRDYMVMMKGHKREGKRDLLICLQSDNGGSVILGHGPIIGVEILKLSNPDNSLASPNPLPLMQDPSCRRTMQELSIVLGCRNVIATVAVALLALLNIILHTMRAILEASVAEKDSLLSATAQRVCRRFAS